MSTARQPEQSGRLICRPRGYKRGAEDTGGPSQKRYKTTWADGTSSGSSATISDGGSGDINMANSPYTTRPATFSGEGKAPAAHVSGPEATPRRSTRLSGRWGTTVDASEDIDMASSPYTTQMAGAIWRQGQSARSLFPRSRTDS